MPVESGRATGRKVRLLVVVALWALGPASLAVAVDGGQTDDFEDGTTMGWVEGGPSPNPPTNEANGGPAGAGDAYMRDASSGGFGAGSRMIVFNRAQWAGDYAAASIAAIEMDVNNLGNTDLALRIAVEATPGGFASHYGSATAVAVPSGSGWVHVTFPLQDLVQIDGNADLATVLAQVDELRVMHSPDGPTWRQPQAVVATLGIDNVTATVAGGGGAGRVPNAADAPGEPLRVAIADGTLTLAWGASCEAGDMDFAIYEGGLGDPAGLTPLTCSTGGATTFDTPEPAGNVFYLVVPQGDGAEGSYGVDSTATPRMPSASACQPQNVTCD